MSNLVTRLVLYAMITAPFLSACRGPASNSASIELSLDRTFGSCADLYAGVTDLSDAVGECAVIEVLVNRFNEAHRPRLHVRTEVTPAAAYYDRLSAAFAARHPPDVALMHRSLLPDFVRRGLVLPLSADLARAGVDWSDFVPAALDGVRTGDELFALPFDLHALLWHINLELLERAGLTTSDGSPILPSSPEELLEHARTVKERTGKRYLAVPSIMDPMPSWTFETWIWQQDGNLLSSDGQTPALTDPPARAALALLNRLYTLGHASAGLDYTGAEQAFLSGEAAVLLNGTWVVDSYLTQAQSGKAGLHAYTVRSVPALFSKPAAWTDSHVWVLPKREALNGERHQAALIFLRFLYDQSGAWARTGHLPVRISVLNGPEFRARPLREGYADTPVIARRFPPVLNQRAIGFALMQELNATWLKPRPPEESLSAVQAAVGRILLRSRRAELRIERARAAEELAATPPLSPDR